jgi:hypothetical protein
MLNGDISFRMRNEIINNSQYSRLVKSLLYCEFNSAAFHKGSSQYFSSRGMHAFLSCAFDFKRTEFFTI